MLTPVSDSLLFKGRPGDPRLGEWVLPGLPDGPGDLEEVVIVGCADDEGVRLNRGRAGAAGGPDGIRKHLYRMTPPMDFEWEGALRLWDAGNIVAGKGIEETHARAFASASAIARGGAILIWLGGGHDFAAPGFLGFLEGEEGRLGKLGRAALINADPHLDVRPLEDRHPHSGSPFRQILESGRIRAADFVEFGARVNRNARSHFAFCKERGVRVLTLEELRLRKKRVDALFRAELGRLARASRVVGASFDMDGCREAEGVSAPPVLGFSAWELVRMAWAAGETKKVRYFEIAEVAPALDPSERSCRIAAEMVYSFLLARARRVGS